VATVFFSYCHKDETFRDQLEVHLSALKRQKAIESWHDRTITVGSAIDDVIDRHLDKAEVILILISPDFIASDYCYDKEMQRALQRHSEGAARVIPVILRPCDWHSLLFGKLLATPRDGRAITLWANHDEAFLDVVRSIKTAIQDLRKPSVASVLFLPVTSNSIQQSLEVINEHPARAGESRNGDVGSEGSTQAASNKGIDAKGTLGFSPRIGIDLGTKFTRIYVEGRGIVLNTPSVIAIDKSERNVVAVGEAALDLIFKTHSSARLIRPVRESIISNPDAAFQMLRHFLHTIGVPLGCRAVFSIPAVATQADLKVLFDIARRLKLSKVEFVPRTLLAARTDSGPAGARMVVELGAGTTDIGIVAESRLYFSRFLRTGGDAIDDAICRDLKRMYNLLTGERTAEAVKIQVGSARKLDEKLSLEIRGRDVFAGPREVLVQDQDIRETILECVAPVIRGIRDAIERMAPDIASQVFDGVIALSGGGALIRGLDKLIQETYNVQVITQKDPICSVASAFGPLFEGTWNVAAVPYPSPQLRSGLYKEP
jgi:rod shape-determining protein MreB